MAIERSSAVIYVAVCGYFVEMGLNSMSGVPEVDRDEWDVEMGVYHTSAHRPSTIGPR